AGPNGCDDESALNGSGPIAGCGDSGGLWPGAHWPMSGGCPTRIKRSAAIGPRKPHLSHLDGGAPEYVVDDQGILYGATWSYVHALRDDGKNGQELWRRTWTT